MHPNGRKPLPRMAFTIAATFQLYRRALVSFIIIPPPRASLSLRLGVPVVNVVSSGFAIVRDGGTL